MGVNTTMKPTIKFTGDVEFLSVHARAILGDVKKHPRLGDMAFATTSKVLKIRIETLNSVYEWEDETKPGDRPS